MEMIFDIGEDVSFVFSSDAVGSGQTCQPERATFFTYFVVPIIANAELSDIEPALGNGDEYGFGKT